MERCVPCGDGVTTVGGNDEIETTPVTAESSNNSQKYAVIASIILGCILVIVLVAVAMCSLHRRKLLPCQRPSEDNSGAVNYTSGNRVPLPPSNGYNGRSYTVTTHTTEVQDQNGNTANGSEQHATDTSDRATAENAPQSREEESCGEDDVTKPLLGNSTPDVRDGPISQSNSESTEERITTSETHAENPAVPAATGVTNEAAGAHEVRAAEESIQQTEDRNTAAVPVSPAATGADPEPAGNDEVHMPEESTRQTERPEIPNNDFLYADESESDEQVNDSQLLTSSGNEVESSESSDRNLQFEQDLELFEYKKDKRALKKINKPDAVHEALSSQDCLECMCNHLPGKIETRYLKEFLVTARLNNKQLLDSVKMDEVDRETKDDEREKKRRYLVEMRKEQGEQLSPRILLNKAHSFRIRALYDELCQGFIKYFDQ